MYVHVHPMACDSNHLYIQYVLEALHDSMQSADNFITQFTTLYLKACGVTAHWATINTQ